MATRTAFTAGEHAPITDRTGDEASPARHHPVSLATGPTRRIILPRLGDPAVLTLDTNDIVRDQGPGEATVQVEAAGVSFAEVQMLRGRYVNQPKLPVVPGYDLVGRIVATGEGVERALLGRRVAALTETGAWADRVTLAADRLVAVPDGVDPAGAVTVVTNGVTAWQMVHRAARVQAGDTVVVHGASGGVGTLLVQIARLAGAEVIGTASAAKHDAVRALGAKPVDYRAADLLGEVRRHAADGVAAVFDHVGGPGLVQSWRMLRRGGTLVSYGSAATLAESGHRLRPYVPIAGRIMRWNLLPNGKRATFYYVRRWPKHVAGDLAAVLSLVAEGRISPQVARRMPLERAAEAVGLLASGAVSGKIVLMPGMDAASEGAGREGTTHP